MVCATRVFLFLLVITSPLIAFAQALSGGPLAVVASITPSGEFVRVVGEADVCEIRVQLMSPTGTIAFDSGWRYGNLADLEGTAALSAFNRGADRFVLSTRLVS